MQKQNILFKEAQITTAYLKNFFQMELPKIAVILGSGLGDFVKITKILKSIKYSDIPLFPISTVEGHRGLLSVVELDNGRKAIVMEGRFHLYEGYSTQHAMFPIVVLHLLGVTHLIVSNAAGGCNPNFNVGDLMLINDHINFSGYNPLIGFNDASIGARFVDLTEPYSNDFRAIAYKAADKISISPKEGVYIAVSGPSYETRAEIRAFQVLGADAVGMSTVCEVILANYFKMNVLGISSITNMATGIANTKHSHAEVVRTAKESGAKFSLWLKEIIALI